LLGKPTRVPAVSSAAWRHSGHVSCNHRIIVPSLKLEFDVKKGLQTIEFTPDKVGKIPWSCWMGMLHGDFEVMEEAPVAPAAPAVAVETTEKSSEKAAAPNAVAPSSPGRHESYAVSAGDTLRGIAVKLYHDAKRWRDIAVANPGLDLRRLRPGQVIQLPELSEGQGRP